jgi:predicted ABC-type ATPase
MPELYIITGANGAGKSSLGYNYLPEYIQNNFPIFDGDKLFVQKQKELWASGMRAHKEAKKIAYQFVTGTFDRLVEEALDANSNFVYEEHFTNDATWDIPKRFKSRGYYINLIFLGLTNPDMSELRVISRVKEGGHFVPRITIEDNFYGNLEKLDMHYPVIDNLTIIDTSQTDHLLLAQFKEEKLVYSLPLERMPLWFTKNLKRKRKAHPRNHGRFQCRRPCLQFGAHCVPNLLLKISQYGI